MIRRLLLALVTLSIASTAVAQQCYVVDWKKGEHCSTVGPRACPTDNQVYTFDSADQCSGFIRENQKLNYDIGTTACKKVPVACGDVKKTPQGSLLQSLVEAAIIADPGSALPIIGAELFLTSLFSTDKEAEARKQREAQAREAARLAEEQRLREETERAAAEKLRLEEERKSDLLAKMKGVTRPRGELPAKPSERAELRTMETKSLLGSTANVPVSGGSKRPVVWRDVDSAWKQVSCGLDLALKATNPNFARTPEEVGYFANEAGRAMNGEMFGEGCPPTAPLTRPNTALIARQKQALQGVVADLKAAADPARLPPSGGEDVPELRTALRQPASERPPAQDAPKDPPRQAPPAQPPPRSADDQRIQEAYRQQQENERKQREQALAVFKVQKENEAKLNAIARLQVEDEPDEKPNPKPGTPSTAGGGGGR